ncbi:hypothetical protein ACFWPX_05580 [Nocardia sp. NPDC058518]|uniref:hypothetical protein n=1 Tax=Nocardia sp. NPDC058518 TaxID=3346534 RepID=UPI0036522FD9
MPGDHVATDVWDLLSEHRLDPFLRVADGDRDAALALYAWSSRTAAVSFEVVGHLEVLLRNALDRELRNHFDETSIGIPWFLMPIPDGADLSVAVETVRTRLRPMNRESRHQIVAGLSFGFWSGLLGRKYEQLWRDCLHRAFPNSSGQRKQLAVAVEGVRKFRNRLAHHDSLLNVDVPFEIRRVLEVAGYMDVSAAKWLQQVSTAMDQYAQRPIAASDTAVVAAKRRLSHPGRHPAHPASARQCRLVLGIRGSVARLGGPDGSQDRSCDRRISFGGLDRWHLSNLSVDACRRSSTSSARQSSAAQWHRSRLCFHTETTLCVAARARDFDRHLRALNRSLEVEVGLQAEGRKL